jgi:hypothetical protein
LRFSAFLHEKCSPFANEATPGDKSALRREGKLMVRGELVFGPILPGALRRSIGSRGPTINFSGALILLRSLEAARAPGFVTVVASGGHRASCGRSTAPALRRRETDLIQYLTGTNDKMFAQALILLQSAEEVGASGLVKVCDFGLTEGERAFLESRAQLAVADPPVPAVLSHPWFHKAAIADFAGPDAETVVWIDADMILMTDPRPHVEALLAAMRSDGREIAATPDYLGPSIGETIRQIAAQGHYVAPFELRLTEQGISREHRYLNSAFFVADSREMLDAWKRITRETNEHCLFEQNAFNVAAWRTPDRVLILDRGVWNLFDADLESASFSGIGSGLLCHGQQVLVLHCAGKFCETIMKTIDVRGCRLSSMLRAFTEPNLRAIQIGLLERFVAENQEPLVEML